MNATWTDPRLAKWEPVLATLPAIFREVIDPEMGRGLDGPVVQDGYVIATNGDFGVRVPSTAELAGAIAAVRAGDEHKGKVARIGNVLDGVPGEPASLPDPGLDVVCEGCGGAGHFDARRCDDCGGGGRDDCPHCGQDMDCEACDGSGRLPARRCDECKGEGVVAPEDEEYPLSVRVTPDLAIARHYVRMLSRHGVTEVVPPAAKGMPALFVAGDVEGGVMPMTLT